MSYFNHFFLLLIMFYFCNLILIDLSFFSSFYQNYELAPLGSHSLDWDWRKNLSVNDEIDVCDPSNIWYESTILNKRQIKQNDRKITEIYIGYRFPSIFFSITKN